MRYVRVTRRSLILLLLGIFGVPAVSLVAYTPEHTFVVSPNGLHIDSVVGTPSASSFTTRLGMGDFSYPSYYSVVLGYAHNDYCIEYDFDSGECVGGYDYESWSSDGLLCEYIQLGFESGDDLALQESVDIEDTITVELSVPCLEGEGACPDTSTLAFPKQFLGRELTCDLHVRERAVVSRITPSIAYAQSADDLVRVSAVVREANSGPDASLTLSQEESYAGKRGAVSNGPNPNRGLADKDVFTFKTVYTSVSNTPPTSVQVVGSEILTMNVDVGARSSELHDGRYDNGEQYVATSTLTQGTHLYRFVAQIAGGEVTLDKSPDGEYLQSIAGYSSVAFLPGLQASRLFEEGFMFEDKLWEPNRDADARSLVMNGDGTSANPDIYTKPGPEGALDEAFGFTSNIYKSFLDDLASWKDTEHVIADYAVLPYDWRLAFNAVLDGGRVEDGKLYYDASYATDTPYIFSELERLVEGSDSGRITLVGHSMGGLIIKKFLADMEDNPAHPYRDLLGKIDVVILVASPQLGTPKAVGSFLHGFGQELDIPPFGIPNFATDDTLRRIGRDMPSGYTLIPSETYFERVRDVAEDGTVLPSTTILKGRGVVPVDSYQEMRDYFATDYGSAENDITMPLQPREDFLNDAEALHARIDGWYPPDLNRDDRPDFRVVQIAGWGIKDTLSGVEYVNRKRRAPCPPNITGTCYENYLNPEPVMTHDGDGTVVVPSAVAMGKETDETRGVETWYVDMYQYNLKNTNRAHASILEVASVRDSILNAVQGTPIQADFFHTTTDALTISDPQLRLAMHSPVQVSVRDNAGNTVGVREENGVIFVDEEIPNSYYFTLGEGKYLGMPSNGTSYTVELKGLAEGVFTFELTEEDNGKVLSTRTFVDVPVTTTTQGTLVLSGLDDVEVLKLDNNGDGVVDNTVRAKEVKEPVTFDLLTRELSGLTTLAKPLLLQTVRLGAQFEEKNKHRLAIGMLTLLKEQVKYYVSLKKYPKLVIPKDVATRIITLIDELILTLK